MIILNKLWRYCDVKMPSLKQHLQHELFHRYISRNFHCGYKQCNKFCKHDAFLRVHLIRNHGILLNVSRKIEKNTTVDKREMYVQ